MAYFHTNLGVGSLRRVCNFLAGECLLCAVSVCYYGEGCRPRGVAPLYGVADRGDAYTPLRECNVYRTTNRLKTLTEALFVHCFLPFSTDRQEFYATYCRPCWIGSPKLGSHRNLAFRADLLECIQVGPNLIHVSFAERLMVPRIKFDLQLVGVRYTSDSTRLNKDSLLLFVG